jgi:BolA protein
MRSIRDDIIARLSALEPTALSVADDSSSHAGHRGAAEHTEKTGASGGTHFEISICSPQFEGKTPVARHRMIYQLLDDLMKSQIHALKIDARTS